MAELRPVPGGRETPQGELRPEAGPDEGPRSPVAEEPRGDGSSGSEAKVFPGEEEELDPRIQVRGPTESPGASFLKSWPMRAGGRAGKRACPHTSALREKC